MVTKVSKIDLAKAQVNCNEAVNSRLNRLAGKILLAPSSFSGIHLDWNAEAKNQNIR
jgi:hypothetical protein